MKHVILLKLTPHSPFLPHLEEVEHNPETGSTTIQLIQFWICKMNQIRLPQIVPHCLMDMKVILPLFHPKAQFKAIEFP
jgi:hypothetical protein